MSEQSKDQMIVVISTNENEGEQIGRILSALTDKFQNLKIALMAPEAAPRLASIDAEAAVIFGPQRVSVNEQKQYLEKCLSDLAQAKFNGRVFLVGFAQKLVSQLNQMKTDENGPLIERARSYHPMDLYGAVYRMLSDRDAKLRKTFRMGVHEQVEIDVESTRALISSRLKSVSSFGAAIDFSGSEPLQIGAIVTLVLPPGVGKPRETIKCRVAWIERLGREEDSVASAGLQFFRGA